MLIMAKKQNKTNPIKLFLFEKDGKNINLF